MLSKIVFIKTEIYKNYTKIIGNIPFKYALKNVPDFRQSVRKSVSSKTDGQFFKR